MLNVSRGTGGGNIQTFAFWGRELVLRQRSLNSGFPVTFGPGDEGGGGDINKNDRNL